VLWFRDQCRHRLAADAESAINYTFEDMWPTSRLTYVMIPVITVGMSLTARRADSQ